MNNGDMQRLDAPTQRRTHSRESTGQSRKLKTVYRRCVYASGLCVSALLILVACRQTVRPFDSYDPAHDIGSLFSDVQLAGIFPDSKEFVDARPRGAPATIEARYDSARRTSGFVLRAFVDQNFILPQPAGDGYHTVASQTMVQHINSL